jgi:hypothetical protein
MLNRSNDRTKSVLRYGTKISLSTEKNRNSADPNPIHITIMHSSAISSKYSSGKPFTTNANALHCICWNYLNPLSKSKHKITLNKWNGEQQRESEAS